MTELESEVLEEIRLIARTELDFQEAIEPAHTLQHDLQLDSLSTTVVAVGLENRFRIRLEEGDAGALVTVGDLVALVCRRVAEQHAAQETGT